MWSWVTHDGAPNVDPILGNPSLLFVIGGVPGFITFGGEHPSLIISG